MDLFTWLVSGYLTFGQVVLPGQQSIVKHGGLQVVHADGAVTLRLKEVGRREEKEGGARHVVMTLRDEYYPLEVVRHVRSWDDCAAVETWVEVRHNELAPVKLIRMDSIAAPVT